MKKLNSWFVTWFQKASRTLREYFTLSKSVEKEEASALITSDVAVISFVFKKVGGSDYVFRVTNDNYKEFTDGIAEVLSPRTIDLVINDIKEKDQELTRKISEYAFERLKEAKSQHPQEAMNEQKETVTKTEIPVISFDCGKETPRGLNFWIKL